MNLRWLKRLSTCPNVGPPGLRHCPWLLTALVFVPYEEDDGGIYIHNDACKVQSEGLDTLGPLRGEQDGLARCQIITYSLARLWRNSSIMVSIPQDWEGGSWRIFGDASVTIAQWRRARDLGHPQVPGSIPAEIPAGLNKFDLSAGPRFDSGRNHYRLKFEQIDPQARVRNYCFQ